MMKKTLIIILAVAALVSCNKGILGKTNGENTTSAPELVFNLSANYPDGAAITEVKDFRIFFQSGCAQILEDAL